MRCDERRLKKLQALERAAKKGPWFAHPGQFDRTRCEGIRTGRRPFTGDVVVETDSGVYPPDLPTAQFIAEARTAVPDLIADLVEARAEIKRLGQQREEMLLAEEKRAGRRRACELPQAEARGAGMENRARGSGAPASAAAATPRGAK